MNVLKLKSDYSNLEAFETKIAELGFYDTWEQFQIEAENLNYSLCEYWKQSLAIHGLFFEYGLDAQPYNFILKF